MGAVASISAALIAAGGTAYSISNANRQRKDAQGAADRQADEQQRNMQREKDLEQANESAKIVQTQAGQAKQDQLNKGGYRSTISTSPTGLTGVAVTGGQKTLLGA